MSLRRKFPTLILLAAFFFIVGCSTTSQHRTLESLAVLKSITFSPDGKLLAAGRNIFNVVLLYDVGTLEVKKAFKGRLDDLWGKRFAHSVAFSPDGKYLAVAGIDDMVIIWDVATGEELLYLSQLKNVLAVAFSPKGKILATAGPGNESHLIDSTNGRELAVLAGHEGTVTCVEFSKSGKIIATGSSDGTVRLWDVKSAKIVARTMRHQAPVTSLSFSMDGKTLVSTDKYQARYWKLISNEPIEKVVESQYLRAGKEVVSGGIILMALADMITFTDPHFLWNTFAHGAIARAEPPRAKFSPDGKYLAYLTFHISSLSDYNVIIIDLATKKTIQIKGQIFDFAFSPDGQVLATAGAWGVKLWNPATGTRIKK